MYEYRARLQRLHAFNAVILEVDLGFNITVSEFFILKGVRASLQGKMSRQDEHQQSHITEYVSSWFEENNDGSQWPLIVLTDMVDRNSYYLVELYAQGNPQSLNETLTANGWGDIY